MNSYLACEKLANLCGYLSANQNKLVLYSRDLSDAWHNMADASQDENEPTFKFIEEIHNCPAAWNVSSVVYKDTIKNKHTKKQKMEQLRDKLGFVHITFLFLHRSLILLSVFFFCFPFIHKCHCSKSAILQITLSCDLTLVWLVTEQVCQLQFTDLSLVCDWRLALSRNKRKKRNHSVDKVKKLWCYIGDW